VFKCFEVLQRAFYIVDLFKLDVSEFEDLAAFSFDFTGFWSVTPFGMEGTF
jgi:hypothetical protein